MLSRHIPNLNNLFKGIEELLNKKGVFIFEEPYLGDVIRLTSYDQIYDEHVYLFSFYFQLIKFPNYLI